MSLKCLIVDDEPIAQQIVEKYCAYLPELDIVGVCGDALQAKQILSSNPVDLIFLDINMPVLDGFAFLKTLKRKPQIIFTTAYKEYAHEAFNVDACDYLLKPFSFERFIQAVDKAKTHLGFESRETMVADPIAKSSLYIKSEGKLIKIDIKHLQYAEAQGNSVKVVTDDNVFNTTITLSAFEDQLPRSEFIRVHRSFLINKTKIQIIEGNRVYIGKTEIPIGQNYREEFFRLLGIK